ncbi:MAG: twin-arginine translocase TatA/TatE family subunit [Planctomycetes bacterium]|nr:twin-arginine translocase TatA/TatE family subunit [Planctomycetota bacterium]
MFGMGIWELLIVFGIILLLFGSSKLPVLMRNLGRSVVEFKEGMNTTDEESPKNIGK